MKFSNWNELIVLVRVQTLYIPTNKKREVWTMYMYMYVYVGWLHVAWLQIAPHHLVNKVLSYKQTAHANCEENPPKLIILQTFLFRSHTETRFNLHSVSTFQIKDETLGLRLDGHDHYDNVVFRTLYPTPTPTNLLTLSAIDSSSCVVRKPECGFDSG